MVSMKHGLRKRQAKRGGMCGCGESLTRISGSKPMVDGSIWGAEVAGSSPVSPTIALQGDSFLPPI